MGVPHGPFTLIVNGCWCKIRSYNWPVHDFGPRRLMCKVMALYSFKLFYRCSSSCRRLCSDKFYDELSVGLINPGKRNILFVSFSVMLLLLMLFALATSLLLPSHLSLWLLSLLSLLIFISFFCLMLSSLFWCNVNNECDEADDDYNEVSFTPLLLLLLLLLQLLIQLLIVNGCHCSGNIYVILTNT